MAKMTTDEQGLEWVAMMARLGKEDRALYRKLRQEAWDLIVEAHAEKSAEQQEKWLENAS